MKVVKSDDNHLGAKILTLYEKDLVEYNLVDNLILRIGQIFIILWGAESQIARKEGNSSLIRALGAQRDETV